jgi:hypothetical protein
MDLRYRCSSQQFLCLSCRVFTNLIWERFESRKNIANGVETGLQEKEERHPFQCLLNHSDPRFLLPSFSSTSSSSRFVYCPKNESLSLSLSLPQILTHMSVWHFSHDEQDSGGENGNRQTLGPMLTTDALYSHLMTHRRRRELVTRVLP